MRKNTKKAVCIFFAVLLLVCSFPISAFAVDPISATAIANGFAQAITAYGASHGVSMLFDGIGSGNTDQIGERVHELWSRFRAGQQTADDYDTIAAAVFPGLYNKVIKAGGTAAVGLSIAQQYMPDIDGFWNWLLSGPAEMVKVDNAYQWNVDSTTGDIVEPVVSRSLSINAVSVPNTTSGRYADWDSVGLSLGDYMGKAVVKGTQDVFVYAISGSSPPTFVFVSLSNDAQVKIGNGTGSNGWRTNLLTNHIDSTTGLYYAEYTGNNTSAVVNPVIPLHTLSDLDYSVDTIKVAPYVGDAVAKPVPIPDNDDPDYGPIPWVGGLDIPWNDTLFGDGTGALTDAQKEAISGALDQAIEDDGTLVLEGDDATDNPGTDTDDPPSSDPDDYGVIGLENIFPFCIPFDIYNFLSALAATPTAPHFTATLQLPSALGGAQTIDLDFDNPTFNQLAQLLRLLELLAFIVGLALLTRSMFIRG